MSELTELTTKVEEENVNYDIERIINGMNSLFHENQNDNSINEPDNKNGITDINADTARNDIDTSINNENSENNDAGIILSQSTLFTPVKSSSTAAIDDTDDKVSEGMSYSTPIIVEKNDCCTDAMCSICLSPLLFRTELFETKCKHVFHASCLTLAKGRKAECPNCRAELSPLIHLQPLPQHSVPNDVGLYVDYSMGYGSAIRARASAAREASRCACKCIQYIHRYIHMYIQNYAKYVCKRYKFLQKNYAINKMILPCQ